MGIFHCNSQEKETRTIWRLFQLKVLSWGLNEGMIFQWFAINIPYDLVNSNFQGDIDLIGQFLAIPGRQGPKVIHKTWEVKVNLLEKTSKSKSLKAGKTENFIKQLNVQKDFGSGNTSLLELTLCEPGAAKSVDFPTKSIKDARAGRVNLLSATSFGYQFMAFEHENDEEGNDIRLTIIKHPSAGMLDSAETLLKSTQSIAHGSFKQMTDQIDELVKSKQAKGTAKLGDAIVIFCRTCKETQVLSSKDEFQCKICNKDLFIP